MATSNATAKPAAKTKAPSAGTKLPDALKKLKTGRTTIVIAHRLSTIRDANRILVLDQGRIVAQGSHSELLTSSELYRRMCARLSVGRSLDDPETVDELMQAG